MKGLQKRDYLIDTLKGLMLVIMTLDHTPLFITRFTYGFFGFFTAAIGFIFISGYLFGMIYSRYLDEPKYLFSKTYNRIWYIYKYHIGIFLLVFFINYFFSIVTYKGTLLPNFSNLYGNHIGIIKIFFLLRQPGYFDVLPLYILLLLFSPIILLGFKKGYANLILSISFFIWVGFQLDVVQKYYESFQLSFRINLGYFVFFSWHFLFTLALYFGYKKHKGEKIITYSKKGILISFLAGTAIFLIRHLDPYLNWGIFQEVMSKNMIRHLAPFQMISFFIAAYFIGGISKHLNVNKINFFSFLGKYSIDVFIFHIPIVYLTHKNYIFISELSYLKQLLIAIGLVYSLAIPAIIKEEYKFGINENRLNRIIENVNLIILLPRDLLIMIGDSQIWKKLHPAKKSHFEK